MEYSWHYGIITEVRAGWFDFLTRAGSKLTFLFVKGIPSKEMLNTLKFFKDEKLPRDVLGIKTEDIGIYKYVKMGNGYGSYNKGKRAAKIIWMEKQIESHDLNKNPARGRASIRNGIGLVRGGNALNITGKKAFIVESQLIAAGMEIKVSERKRKGKKILKRDDRVKMHKTLSDAAKKGWEKRRIQKASRIGKVTLIGDVEINVQNPSVVEGDKILWSLYSKKGSKSEVGHEPIIVNIRAGEGFTVKGCVKGDRSTWNYVLISYTTDI